MMNRNILFFIVVLFFAFVFGCKPKRTNSKSSEQVIAIPDSVKIELLYQHPHPVITTNHPDANGNKFGFEGGTAVKIDGTYHLFTSEMVDNPIWVKMRLGYWTSTDRLNWKRQGTIAESSGEFEGRDPRAAVWAPMVVFDTLSNCWNLFYVGYNSAPGVPDQFRLNMNGKIYRNVSETLGIEGISGPYKEIGIILDSSTADEWEGLQGTDSFYPWKVDNKWYAFYGSAKTEKLPAKHWLVGFAKSESSDIAGPWEKLSDKNPAPMEKVFIENPIVLPLKRGGWICVYDNQVPNAFGYAYSKDGINWGKGQSVAIQQEIGQWAFNVRTVLGLIQEDENRFTIFYTGFEQDVDWSRLFTGIGKETCAIGFVEVSLKLN